MRIVKWSRDFILLLTAILAYSIIIFIAKRDYAYYLPLVLWLSLSLTYSFQSNNLLEYLINLLKYNAIIILSALFGYGIYYIVYDYKHFPGITIAFLEAFIIGWLMICFIVFSISIIIRGVFLKLRKSD
jgi:hypothetical protein